MKKNHNLFFIICIFIALLFLSVGFARVNNTTLTITGHGGAAENGDIKITNVTLKTKTENVTASQPTWSEDSNEISFDVSFTIAQNDPTVADEHSATYEITLLNDTISEYSFGSSLFTPTLNITPPPGETLTYAYDVEGINIGDIIPAKTSVTFTVKLTLYPSGGAGTYTGGVTTEVDAEEEVQGLLLGAFKNNNNTGNLTGNNTSAPITISVMNTNNEAKTFSFWLTNNNFSVVDANGNGNLTFTVPANTESQDYTIYIKRNPNVTFGNSPQRFNLYLNPSDGDSISIGTVSMNVDVDPNFYDNEPPVINSLTATRVTNARSLNIQWQAQDNYGIDHYELYLYNGSNNNQIGDPITTTDSTYTFTDLADGNYYVKLYAYDGKGNNSNSSTNSTSYSWTYTVTYTTSNNASKTSGPDTISAGETLTATFNNSGLIGGFNGHSVTMGGTTLTDGTDYTWSTSGNTGTVVVQNVSGNITISVQGSCLIEGTKILLANGKYKNIENITYNDLLAVWDYEHGKITYEYPIWIEKEKETNFYQKTTFSDGSELKTFGYHGVFSPTYNQFISVDDPDRYKVGTKVTKISNGKLKEVTIKKIEMIVDTVKYYHVVSTRYYNIIANDVLTTDGTVVLTNLYGFDSNIKWNRNIRNNVINNKNNIYSYDEFKDIMPYYMFSGLRAEEGKHLANFGLSKEIFAYYLMTNQLNEDMLLNPPVNNKNTRIWVVTTDLDKVTKFNLKTYLHEEGSTYTLPKNKDVVKYYSTSEDKYYNPGDTVTVWHGMHFISLKKNN